MALPVLSYRFTLFPINVMEHRDIPSSSTFYNSI